MSVCVRSPPVHRHLLLVCTPGAALINPGAYTCARARERKRSIRTGARVYIGPLALAREETTTREISSLRNLDEIARITWEPGRTHIYASRTRARRIYAFYARTCMYIRVDSCSKERERDNGSVYTCVFRATRTPRARAENPGRLDASRLVGPPPRMERAANGEKCNDAISRNDDVGKENGRDPRGRSAIHKETRPEEEAGSGGVASRERERERRIFRDPPRDGKIIGFPYRVFL